MQHNSIKAEQLKCRLLESFNFIGLFRSKLPSCVYCL